MGKKSKGTSPKSKEKKDLTVRLEQIEHTVQEISELRKKQSLINLGSIAIILIIALVFVYNMYCFAKEFDNQMLMDELKIQATEMVKSPDMKKFAKDLQRAFVPAYKDALIKTLKHKAPEFRKTAVGIAENLNKYMKNDIQKEIEKELTISLNNFEQQLVKRYPNLEPNDIHKVLEHSKAKFMVTVAERTDKKLTDALNELAILRNSFYHFQSDPIYKKLQKSDMQLIQNNLIEAVLELWIYSINPAKGNAPAGGVK